MKETIQERLHRLANAGRKTVKVAEKPFNMPQPLPTTTGKSYLTKLLDEIDSQRINKQTRGKG